MLIAEKFTTEGFKNLERFLNSGEDGSFYVGHATVLIQIEGQRYIVDAVTPKPLFLESWLFFPNLIINQELLSKIDGVFISHCHEDHYDIPLLKSLKPNTPIYITKGRTGLEEIKNDPTLNVLELTPMTFTEIGPKIKVFPIASDHNDFDSSFVIKGKNFSVFQGNDNFFGDETLQKASAAVGKVNHCYIPFAYVWWYPYCLTSLTDQQRLNESKRLTEHNMHIGAKMAKAFGADLVVPSAANLVFFEGADSILNQEIASSFDFMDFVQENYSELASKTKTFFSGDYATVASTESGLKQTISQRNFSKKMFFEMLDEFLKVLNSKIPSAKPRSELVMADFEKVKNKISNKNLRNKDISLYFRRRDLPSFAYKVSMKDYSSVLEKNPQRESGSITFDIQPHAFEMWLDDKISFETILNSQRFTAFRNPEVFDPEVWTVIRNNF